MNKVYLGSQNPIKFQATKDVFSDYEVVSYDSNSCVDAQPKSIEETINGAYNRAKDIDKDGLKIGLEAGVTLINNECFLINFGVLIDIDGYVYYAGGTFIPLPEEVRRMLFEEHIELKDAMKKLVGIDEINKKEGTIGFLTNNLINRYDIFTHICKLLLGQMLTRKNK